jgi:Tfp pilus assembly PilM family ATPase
MEQDKELYERQIWVVDKQIDKLVYDLYRLTEEEIEVVEGEK